MDAKLADMRALVYVRMSQDRTGSELGIDRQRTDCLALIDSRAWSLARPTLSDNDVSASGRKPRPAFQALLAAIKAGEADAIVSWSLDRLTRNARDRLALVEACQEHKVLIALVRGSDIDCSTLAGRLTAGILGEVAQHEIATKADRQTRAAQQAAEQGRWIGGPRPFGYQSDGVTVIDVEANALRAGYNDLLAGVPLGAIATRWNQQGLRTGQRPWKHDAPEPGGNSTWRADAVRRALLNPRYAGIRSHRRVEIGPAVWPALIPVETFRAAQAVLRDPNRNAGGARAAGRQLLTGIAVCGNDLCGRPVHGGGATHKKPIYRCSSDSDRSIPKSAGKHPNRLAGPIDAYVRDLVIARLSRDDAVDLLVDDERPDVPALRAEANALRARLDSLAADFATEVEVSLSEYRAMTKNVRTRLAMVEEQLADAGRVSLLGDLVRADDVAAVWDSLETPRKRTVIEELMTVRIHLVGHGVRTFRPETVEVSWKSN